MEPNETSQNKNENRKRMKSADRRTNQKSSLVKVQKDKHKNASLIDKEIKSEVSKLNQISMKNVSQFVSQTTNRFKKVNNASSKLQIKRKPKKDAFRGQLSRKIVKKLIEKRRNRIQNKSTAKNRQQSKRNSNRFKFKKNTSSS